MGVCALVLYRFTGWKTAREVYAVINLECGVFLAIFNPVLPYVDPLYTVGIVFMFAFVYGGVTLEPKHVTVNSLIVTAHDLTDTDLQRMSHTDLVQLVTRLKLLVQLQNDLQTNVNELKGVKRGFFELFQACQRYAPRVHAIANQG